MKSIHQSWKTGIVATILVSLLLILFPFLHLPVSAAESDTLVNKHKIMFDSATEYVDGVNSRGNVYYVVRYDNLFPFADGV